MAHSFGEATKVIPKPNILQTSVRATHWRMSKNQFLGQLFIHFHGFISFNIQSVAVSAEFSPNRGFLHCFVMKVRGIKG